MIRDLRGRLLPAGQRLQQILGALAAVEERSDVLFFRAALRLHHRHPDQRLPADVEDDRVPAGRDDLGRVLREAPAAEDARVSSGGFTIASQVSCSSSSVFIEPRATRRW